MKYLRFSAVAVTLVLAACDKTPTSPTSAARLLAPTRESAALIANNRVDINTVALSDCGTEDVLVTGNFHEVLTITGDNAGGFHINDHIDFTGLQGVGVVTGTEYVAKQLQTTNFNIPANQLTFEATLPLEFTLISRGNTAPDEVFSGLLHITFNANGEPTSFVDNLRVKCS